MEHNIKFYKDKNKFLEAWVCDCKNYSAYKMLLQCWHSMVIILKKLIYDH